mmetsp:Transcript_110419/g.276416  ORF Transcript_110419/g.276416 Transcript_110419/m.276416 type:complete len:252 (-) Transcript_110419:294-1049(-)|eukprot:CAMPEP_0115268008 /NCGR_PEP_ID=MMETSP0270-20121206/52291_1 /TAXON_ID=71861 /ORGANISM="Scrippsiella trochoidea, Strain CCMP3099" /LENGTH=251 /DNA_ID=CAMNT_0002684181 /DNA_START=68 /DNA_END=823 /DNA_ORIENTATION=-
MQPSARGSRTNPSELRVALAEFFDEVKPFRHGIDGQHTRGRVRRTIQLAIRCSAQPVILPVPVTGAGDESEGRLLVPGRIYHQHVGGVPRSAEKLPVRRSCNAYIPRISNHAFTFDVRDLATLLSLQVDDQHVGARIGRAIQAAIWGNADAHVAWTRTLNEAYRLRPGIDHQNLITPQRAATELASRRQANVGEFVLLVAKPINEGQGRLSQADPRVDHHHAGGGGWRTIQPSVRSLANPQVLLSTLKPLV